MNNQLRSTSLSYGSIEKLKGQLKSEKERIENEQLLLESAINEFIPGSERTVFFNAPQNPKAEYPSNQVSTTKYEWWNFLFKNLWEQFRR